MIPLAALAVLKAFDRRTSDKNALDLYRVISTYADAGNLDRLYDSAAALLEKFGYDLTLPEPHWPVKTASGSRALRL